MLFNSLAFGLFLPVIFFAYWFVFVKHIRLQNCFLLVASYFFYGWWDYRFLFLLAFSTFLDYFTGLRIHGSTNPFSRKLWLLTSVVINLGFLGFFKYYNFFIHSAAELLNRFGLTPHIWTLSIILPVGISFYTFHGLSYVFDIYNRKIEPTRDYIDYSVFVCFFPLLVAGPIERATHLLPQVKKVRIFNYPQAASGMRLILFGFFKKLVVADNCAITVNETFSHIHTASGPELLLGVILFAFQIYGDFSGYSDIARGTARLLGFELLKNFSFPYFSRDIAEFWRRWHISLTTWFRDYLYIPMGGSRTGKWEAVKNTIIVFLVSGFWHGANWTFLFWGLLNALYFIPLLLTGKNRTHLDTIASGKLLPSFREVVQMTLTFAITCFAWIFFRSKDLSEAFAYIASMFSRMGTMRIDLPSFRYELLIVLPLFVIIEWLVRESSFEDYCMKFRKPGRHLIYGFIFMIIFLFGKFNHTEFIYFQF